ncbi:MAG: hypothetical protein RR571_09200, partial [Anaerorhabdus sp.]
TINFYLQEESKECGCGGHDHEHTHEIRDDYEVVGTIKTFGAWANIMPDSYIVKSELKAEEMKAKIMVHLKSNDILLITKVDGEDSASSIEQAKNLSVEYYLRNVGTKYHSCLKILWNSS